MFGKCVLLSAFLLIAPQICCATWGWNGYTNINGSDYYLDTTPYRTWVSTKLFCEGNGWQTVIVDTKEKFDMYTDFFREEFGGYTINLWTDAIRNAGNLTWFWASTSELITEFYWVENREPDLNSNLNERMCITMNVNQGPSSTGWDDEICSSAEYAPFCKMN